MGVAAEGGLEDAGELGLAVGDVLPGLDQERWMDIEKEGGHAAQGFRTL